MWFVVLAACGDDRFSGRLVSATQTPLAAVPVAVGRASAFTDSDGRFSLPPGREATFSFGGTSWIRSAAPGDHALRLPGQRKLEVRCPADAACDLVLSWPEADGWKPTVEHACQPGEAFELEAPTTTPTAACDTPDRDLVVDDRDALLELWPSGRDIDIVLTSADGPLPDDCATWVDGVRAAVVAPGRFRGQGRGAVWVGGQCGDRAIAPVQLPRDGLDAALVWSATGPEWDAASVAPWARELLLTDERGLSVLVRPKGTVFALPSLPPGLWRVRITGEAAVQGSVVMLPEPRGDGFTLATGGQEVLVGVWSVPDPPIAGPVVTH